MYVWILRETAGKDLPWPNLAIGALVRRMTARGQKATKSEPACFFRFPIPKPT